MKCRSKDKNPWMYIQFTNWEMKSQFTSSEDKIFLNCLKFCKKKWNKFNYWINSRNKC